MLKNKIIVALGLTAAMASVSFSETFTHPSGTTELEVTPSKLVVYDLAAVDTLDALSVDIEGLPKAYATSYLSKFSDDNYTDVGTFWEPDFETVAAIQPDLVVVGGRTQTQYEMMSSIAPTIDVTVWGADFLSQFYNVTETLAASVGKKAEADAKLDAIKNRVADIHEKAQGKGNALFILTTGGKISAYGPGSRFGILHDELGVKPAIEDVEAATHGDPITFEFLKDADPDMLFVIDRDAAIGTSTGAAQSLLDNALVKELKAYRNDKIIYVDGFSWYMVAYGIQAVESILTEVEDALN
jgi:iron complex transport system substrate-binding protein